MLSGRKRIVYNPLRSPFIDALAWEVPDMAFTRLRSLGIAVGQEMAFPTRMFRSQTRKFLWDDIEDWPACEDDESNHVNDSEVRYKCTVPAPMQIIDTADAVTQLEEMRSPLELL